MKWPPSSPYSNQIKNLWSVQKMKLFAAGKQYNSKIKFLEAIKTTMSELAPKELKKQFF